MPADKKIVSFLEQIDARRGTFERFALTLMKTNYPGKVQSIVAMGRFLRVITGGEFRGKTGPLTHRKAALRSVSEPEPY